MSAHLVHVFPAFAGGGPEVRTATIINHTNGCFRHTIVSLHENTSGISMLRQPDDVPCMSVDSRSLWSVARLLRRLQPNLVLTYGWGGTDAIAAARLAGIARVLHCEDGFLPDEASCQILRRRVVRRIMFQAARAVVVPSRTLCSIARRTWKIAERRLRYIPNGVDTARFRPADAACRAQRRAEWNLPPDSVIVGTVGALRPDKNQLRLVRVFARIAPAIPNARLLIVGDGSMLEPLKHEARSAGVLERVVFCGHAREPARYYQAMDVFALSSDTEQMSLAVLEAMATGLPVVSTDVGDTQTMVAPINRESIVATTDEHAYGEALRTLLVDRQMRTEVGTANRQHCLAEYSLDRMLNTYWALYREYAA